MEITPESEYSYAIQFDCDQINDPPTFLEDVSNMKKYVMGGALDFAFAALQAGISGNLPSYAYEYRKGEYVFICPTASKIVIIFQVDFLDPTDRAIAKVFLSEFVDAQRSARSAPPVSYSAREPPLEVTNLVFKSNPESAGFLSFGLECRHIDGNRKEQAITLLTGFRNYIHYHVKCSKTYLHMRMRKKGNNWMQVLNRAIPDVDTEKKTMAGKSFTRK